MTEELVGAGRTRRSLTACWPEAVKFRKRFRAPKGMATRGNGRVRPIRVMALEPGWIRTADEASRVALTREDEAGRQGVDPAVPPQAITKKNRPRADGEGKGESEGWVPW